MARRQHDVIRSGPNNGSTIEDTRRVGDNSLGRGEKTLAEKGVFDVSSEDTEYVKVISEAREHVEKCVGPSMPCIPTDECLRKSDAMPIFESTREPEAMNVSMSARSMAQKPIARKKGMNILDATAAVDRDWDKLKSLLAWDFKNVKPKSEVARQAKKDRILPHVPFFMDLCIANTPRSRKSLLSLHQKNKGKCGALEGQRQERQWSQSSIRRTRSISFASGSGKIHGEFQTWRRRRTMRYQHTHRCICLKPYCNCWKTNVRKVWIRLPPSRRPKQWASIEEPMVLFERNPCGHPWAGLLWERKLEEVKRHGEKVPRWECLYVHRKSQPFSSPFV